MSDAPTPPEKPDEPQPVTAGDPLGEGSEPPRDERAPSRRADRRPPPPSR